MTARNKMKYIVNVLDQKKAHDIKVLKLTDLTILADYFVICSAHSTTQVKALADSVEETMDLKKEPLFKKEGKQGLNWILLDYSDVIVHIFYQETREFYGLEKLWTDAEDIDLSKIITTEGEQEGNK